MDRDSVRRRSAPFVAAAVLAVLTSAHAAGPKPPPASVYVDFPSNFRWCTATSAHQVEGGNIHSDWWNWERDNWGVESGRAVDHWNRVDEDIGLMKNINANTYRFSIEWAKVEPRPGYIDESAIQHYKDEVDKLQRAGIRPLITLHHFTFPQWVRDRGGFEWSGVADAFARFTEIAISRIGPRVKDWVTINEPMVHLALGVLADRSPPNRRGELRPIEAVIPHLRGLLKAHAASYHVLHDFAARNGRQVSVGMAHHLRNLDPANPFNPLDIIGAGVFDQAFNWLIPEALETGYIRWPIGFKVVLTVLLPKLNVEEFIPDLKGTQDYFGLNYYTRDRIGINLGADPSTWLKMTPDPEVWEQYPTGFYRLLKETHKRFPNRPVMITENGIVDSSDLKRPRFIEEHLFALRQAMREGVSVIGYCHWSLMDNFEWSMGFVSNYGLYHVDYHDNLKRTPRPSAELFKRIAGNNGFWTQPIRLDQP